jgi:hypothetical protein
MKTTIKITGSIGSVTELRKQIPYYGSQCHVGSNGTVLIHYTTVKEARQSLKVADRQLRADGSRFTGNRLLYDGAVAVLLKSHNNEEI